MGRRRKASTADYLMDLVAPLPWWAGVALAELSYGVLNAFATRPQPVAQAGKQIPDAIPTMIWQAIATGGQYLVAFICLMGALASFLRRRANHRPGSANSVGFETENNQTEFGRRRSTIEPAKVHAPVQSVADPMCPRCAQPMVRLLAKKGGNRKCLWGCSAYSTRREGTRKTWLASWNRTKLGC